jgi:hypothetical protein
VQGARAAALARVAGSAGYRSIDTNAPAELDALPEVVAAAQKRAQVSAVQLRVTALELAGQVERLAAAHAHQVTAETAEARELTRLAGAVGVLSHDLTRLGVVLGSAPDVAATGGSDGSDAAGADVVAFPTSAAELGERAA